MLTHDFNEGPVDVVAGKLLSIARTVGLLVFGLLPLIFIPSIFVSVPQTKIFVASVGLFLVVIFFAFSVLRQGVVRVRFELPIVLMWVAFIVATISAFFSGDFFDSFWGSEMNVNSALFVGVMALAMTVWSGIGVDKKLVVRLYLLLAGSGLILGLFHIVRVFLGPEALSLGIFGSNIVLSPFSEWNSLAVFFGLIIILSMIALEQLSLRLVGRVFFAVITVLSLVMLAIINFGVVFIVLGLVSLIILLYGLTRGKFNTSQVPVPQTSESALSLAVSLAVLFVSMVFVLGGTAVGSAVSQLTGISYIEVRPSFEATVGIAKEVYKESALLGVGPNKFADAWRQYHDISINSTIFWNTSFQAGYGFIPTVFITQGLLGGLLWIVFFATLLFVGMRTFWQNVHADTLWYFIALASFVASVYLWGMSFLYVPGPVLFLLAALCTGLFFAARKIIMPQGVRTCQLMGNQRTAFMTVAVTVLIVVGSVGSLYFMGRHFTASYIYVSAANALDTNTNIPGALQGISNAFALSPDDAFPRRIALYQKDEVRRIMQENKGGLEAQAAFEQALSSALDAAGRAVALDGTDPQNWETLGRVYAEVVSLNMENAYELAVQAFEKARELDPQSPSRLVMLSEVELLKGNAIKAREHIMGAIGLKSNYTDAMYILAQIEISEGNVPAAIESTRAAALLDSNNPVRFFQLGVLELSNSQFEDAKRSLTRATELSPDYANARYFLAFAYDKLGKKNEAKEELKKVLALNPDNTEVQALIGRLDRGESLSPAVAPVAETSETSATKEPVTSGAAPKTPALTPANANTNKTTE